MTAATCFPAVVKWVLLYCYLVSQYLPVIAINFFTQDYEEEEVEAFDVTLTKNTQGLGITIAGYVGDKNSGEMW